MKGRRATSFTAIKDDMVNAGCGWVDEQVVVDDDLISSRHPGDAPWRRRQPVAGRSRRAASRAAMAAASSEASGGTKARCRPIQVVLESG